MGKKKRKKQQASEFEAAYQALAGAVPAQPSLVEGVVLDPWAALLAAPQQAVQSPPERPTTHDFMQTPSNRAMHLLGREQYTMLTQIMERFGSPDEWEIKKTPMAGTWAVYTKRMAQEPLFMTTGQQWADFCLCAALVAAFNAAHMLFMHELDGSEQQDCVEFQ